MQAYVTILVAIFAWFAFWLSPLASMSMLALSGIESPAPKPTATAPVSHANGQTQPLHKQKHFQAGIEEDGLFLPEAYVIPPGSEYSAPTSVADYVAAVNAHKCKSDSTVLLFPREHGVGTVYLVCDERH